MWRRKHRMKSNNSYRGGPPRTHQEIKQVKELVKAGYADSFIARKLGRSNALVGIIRRSLVREGELDQSYF